MASPWYEPEGKLSATEFKLFKFNAIGKAHMTTRIVQQCTAVKYTDDSADQAKMHYGCIKFTVYHGLPSKSRAAFSKLYSGMYRFAPGLQCGTSYATQLGVLKFAKIGFARTMKGYSEIIRRGIIRFS